MPTDACPIAGRHPRKPERRRKRRPKKSTSTQNLALAQPQESLGQAEATIENSVPASVPEILEMKNTPAAEAELMTVVAPKVPAPLPNTGNMSPRKQTLMRHKTNTKTVAEPSFLSEVKEIKKNRKGGSHIDAVDGRYSLMLSHQPMEEKAALFSASLAQIVLYHETLSDSPTRQSAGTLLAHGEFEIFQLHGGDVTYLACGKTFVYPLLPKLKILRTSHNEFVLPLVNPQRYWKICIDTQNEQVFVDLVNVLKRVVKYTDLAGSGVLETTTAAILLPKTLHLDIPADPHAVNLPSLLEVSARTDSAPGMQIPERLDAPFLAICPPKHDPGANPLVQAPEAAETSRAGHVTPDTTSPNRANRGSRNGNYVPFFNEIPESPPSVPVSPRNLALYQNSTDTAAPDMGIPPWESPANGSAPSITSAMASFGLEAPQKPANDISVKRPHEVPNRHILQPRPQALSNPFLQNQYGSILANSAPKQSVSHPNPRPSDAVSETSSMDSLLDEYEETISYTRSIHHNNSRPQSTAASHISAVQSVARSHAGYNYRRGLALNLNLNLNAHLHTNANHEIEGNVGSSHRRIGAGSQIDGFPATSLSGYDRARKNSTGERSRRSSVSELYSATSNWMEPGHIPAVKKLASSKSAYSLVGKARLHHEGSPAASVQSNLNETYREIYRSITLHNLAEDAGHRKGHGAGGKEPLRNRETGSSAAAFGGRASTRERSASQKPVNGTLAHKARLEVKTASTRIAKKEGLSSIEVFKLLSERDKTQAEVQANGAGTTGMAGTGGTGGTEKAPPSSGFRRLFGW